MFTHQFTTWEQAEEAIQAALDDTAGDAGIAVEELDESIVFDLIYNVAVECTPTVGRELMQREFGYVPEGMLDTASGVRYPHVTVHLIGTDGNAFSILGRVRKALQRAGYDTDEYMAEATAGDYDHLVATTMRYVNVE